jgi:hypothetical protein
MENAGKAMKTIHAGLNMDKIDKTMYVFRFINITFIVPNTGTAKMVGQTLN